MTTMFEVRPVIKLDGDCVSYTNETDYRQALHSLCEEVETPAFKTFWTVYMQIGSGFWEALADSNSQAEANQLIARLSGLIEDSPKDMIRTAACVWEAIITGSCENNALWEEWRTNLGSCELRDQVYTLTQWVDQVREVCLKLDADTTLEKPFDWEFVPIALGFIEAKSKDEYPGPEDYPIPEDIAPQVIAKLK